MKNFIIISILFFVFFGSCQKNKNDGEKYATGLFYRQINVNDTLRRYAVYIPEGIDNLNVPLVLELHGGGIYIEDMTGDSGYKTPYKLWMELAEQEKFIVVYPEGLNGAYNKPTWNDCRGDCIVSSDADDVYFLSKLIDHISEQYLVDNQRVYISGTSNGGFMALRMAVCASDKIAAVAAVAAAMPAVSDCSNPSHPISVLFMNGTDDNHMTYNGGYIGNPPNPSNGSALSSDASVDYWMNFNQTATQPEYFAFPDLDPDDGGTIERFSYKNGMQGTEVVLYKINGGGHSAPSISEQYSALFEQYFNKQNHDIEMTMEVWNFFKNITLD